MVNPDFRFEPRLRVSRVLVRINVPRGSERREGPCGGRHLMGEKKNQPFQLSFNSSLKVDFHGSRVTSDVGLILVRE